MKTIVPILFLLLTATQVNSQLKDVPTPAANLQTLPSGSYVIAMDNTLQTNTAGNFNLKAYGLIVHLLNNNVKLKWVIKSGKSKDGIDFTTTAEQYFPTNTAVASRNFKAGPFVIYAEDTTGVSTLVNAYYTARALTGNNRPRVYRTTAAVSVDVRYDMYLFKPKAQILNDGNNSDIHVTYMTLSGVTTTNYAVGPAIDLTTKCFTFASEPHNDNPPSSVISSIRSFVQFGGNFLAQCAAIEAYENHAQGHFHSTNGINVTNTNVNIASTVYGNADLAYSQYEGAFSVKQSGSVNNWTYPLGSFATNSAHSHASGGNMLTQTPIGASVAKLNGSTLAGGLVFYLGNHEYTSITAIQEINGIRMYMNAFLTPARINQSCSIGAALPNPLPVKLIAFDAALKNNATVLKWTTAEEIGVNRFSVERSVDGVHYTAIASIAASGNSTVLKQYGYTDNLNAVTQNTVYYRLCSIDKDGRYEYSAVRVIRLDDMIKKAVGVVSYPNPVTDELWITIPNDWQNKFATFELVDLNGHTTKKLLQSSSSQTTSMNVSGVQAGLYFLRVTCEGQVSTQKIVKK